MIELYDKVLHRPSGKACFVIDIDDGDEVIYGLEAVDQDDSEWFYWASESELERLPED